MIVLFTDFGLAGPYTGQVDRGLAPDRARRAGDPAVRRRAGRASRKPAAYLLAAYAAWFPAGTVFLCVVDPGVGGSRRALIVEADGRRYVGPDNGLFELVLRRADAPRRWEITWRPPHSVGELSRPRPVRPGRGTAGARRRLRQPRRGRPPQFAPARLARRSGRDRLCRPLRQRADRVARRVRARGGATRRPARGRSRLPPTFSAVAEGEAFWYVNSNGLVEIAVNRGRADRALGLAIGSPVSVRGP